MFFQRDINELNECKIKCEKKLTKNCERCENVRHIYKFVNLIC